MGCFLGVTIVNAFQKFLDDSKRKPNKIWVGQGSKFCSNSFKKWLEEIDIKLYPTHNEGKSFVAEIFTKTLKSKIYRHMTAVSNNVYFDVLDDIIDKYNDTYNKTTKKNLLMLNLILTLNTMLNLRITMLNFKLVIL